jgi:hypothetical protein
MLMARLSIVCLLAEDKICSWDKAHADRLISIGRGCVCLFFLRGWPADLGALRCKDTQRHTPGCTGGDAMLNRNGR